MSTTDLVDRNLVSWETDLTASVSNRRREIEEKYGADVYSKALARAMQRDEMAATAYQTWARLAEQAVPKDNPSDQTAYLRALNEAKKQALASVPDGKVQRKVQQRIEGEMDDVLQAASAFKALKEQFGLAYGSPEDAIQEFMHRPEAIQGALGFVLEGFSDFRRFWDQIRPDVERLRKMNGEDDGAVGTAISESQLAKAMKMLLADGASRMTVGAATGGSPADYVLRKFLKGLPEKDRAVVQEDPEPFATFAQARALYIQGAASAEAMASQTAKEKGTTYRQELAATGAKLEALHSQLVQMKESLPPISRDAALWVPPDAKGLSVDTNGFLDFFRGMARGAMSAAYPFEDPGKLALSAPRLDEPKHVAKVIPWNAQAWGEAVGQLGVSLPGFAVGGAVGSMVRVGGGPILRQAVQGAVAGGVGMLAQPETVREVARGEVEQTAARVGIGAAAGGVIEGAIGGVQGAIAGRRAAKAAREAAKRSKALVPVEQPPAVSERSVELGKEAAKRGVQAPAKPLALPSRVRPETEVRTALREYVPGDGSVLRLKKGLRKETLALNASQKLNAYERSKAAFERGELSEEQFRAVSESIYPLRPPPQINLPEQRAPRTPATAVHTEPPAAPKKAAPAPPKAVAAPAAKPFRAPKAPKANKAPVEVAPTVPAKAPASPVAKAEPAALPTTKEERAAAFLKRARKYSSADDDFRSEPLSADFPVKPIRHSGPPPTADEIKVQLGKSAGTAIRTLPQPRRGVLGSFRPSTGTTSIGDAPDIPTAFHEYAHRVDAALNIRKGAPAKALAELDNPLFSTSVSDPANLEHVAKERFAEFVRAMGVNPAMARAEAPTMAKHFVKAVGDRSFSEFARATLMLRRVAGSDPLYRPAANIRNLGEGAGTKQFEMPFPWYRKPLRGIFDPTQPQSAARKFYEDLTGTPMRPTQDPRYWMSRYFAGQDAVREMAKRGLADRHGKPILDDVTSSAMNEEWRVQPIADLVRRGIPESDANKLVGAFLVSETGAERALHGAGRTGVGLGIERDAAIAVKNILATRGAVKTEVPADLIALIREAARRTRKVYDAALDRAVNGHLMSPGDAAALRAKNQHYAHLGRYMEESPFQSTKVKTNAMKAAHGSGRTIINPAQMAWPVVAEVERRAGMNLWKLSLARMARGPREGAKGGLLRDFHLIGREVPEATTNSMPFLEKGVEKHIVFDSKIKQMLDLYQNPSSAMMGASWASLPARVLTSGVVHMPKFATGQLVKEIQDAFVKSASKRFIPTQPLGTLRQTAKDMHEYVISGGGHHGYYANGPMDWVKFQQATTQRLADEGHVVLDPRKLVPRAWANYVEKLRELTDTRMKSAEFQRLKAEGVRAGHSEAEAKAYATIHAREMQDYSLVGTWLMGLSRFVPFLRGGLSGTYAEIRALRRSPGLFVGRGAVLAGGLIAAEEGLHRAAGTLDELRAMPNWARDMYIWIPTGPGEKWVALPTGWLLGGFRSLMRRSWEASQGNKQAWRDMGDSMWQRFSPIDSPTTLAGPLATPIQLAHNFSDFQGRSIVPEWEKDRPVSERKGAAKASRLGQFVSDLVEPLNKYAVDPRQADFFVEQSFGLAGAALLGLSDIGRPDARTSVPVLGIFKNRPKTTEQISVAFELIRKTGKSSDLTYKAMRRRLDMADTDKAHRMEHLRVANELAGRLVAKYGGKE